MTQIDTEFSKIEDGDDENKEEKISILRDYNKYLTFIGSFLRKTSLDEIPQLFSILKGEMSFVGPRPALFNQDDLIALRTEKGLDQLVPGLTGWAQVNGRDELPIQDKVALDVEYMEKRSSWFDIKILFLTFYRGFFGTNAY